MKFQVLDEFIESYVNHINIGTEYAKNKTVCFVSLIRDGGEQLPDRLSALEDLGNFFKQSNYIIYENDSVDGTPAILSSWSNNTNKIARSEKLNSSHPVGPFSKSLERTKALALYRNKCLELVRDKFSDIDHIIVIDLDFLSTFPNGLLNSLGWIADNNIDAMAGFSYEVHPNNGITNYDSWAYRYNWWGDYQPYMMQSFLSWMPFIGSDPFAVNSAFGGTCIYKTQQYLSSKYDGYDCEHVCFHKNLKNKNPNFKLYVNPSQIMMIKYAENSQRNKT